MNRQHNNYGRDQVNIENFHTQNIQKLYDALFNLNLTNQINVMNPDDSEIKSYLSFWDELDSDQRISLVLNCRQYIRNTYHPKRLTKIPRGISNYFLPREFVIAMILFFFLIVQHRSYRDFLQKIEYAIFSSVASAYCNISKDMLIPLPTCNTPAKTIKPSQLKAIQKKEFESYKGSWIEFIVSCIAIPLLAIKIVLIIMESPVRAYQKVLLEREKKELEKEEKELEKENRIIEGERRAKEQTYNILFNRLNDSEKNKVMVLEEALQLEEIKAQVLSLANAVRFMVPNLLRESNMKEVAKFSNLLFPTLDKKTKEELIACLFPDVDRESIVEAIESRKTLRGY